MPPKKANTKAKATPAKAAAVAEPPATITTSRGKEIETTAAAGRPRRASTASADTPAPKVKKTAPAKKAAPKATKATTSMCHLSRCLLYVNESQHLQQARSAVVQRRRQQRKSRPSHQRSAVVKLLLQLLKRMSHQSRQRRRLAVQPKAQLKLPLLLRARRPHHRRSVGGRRREGRLRRSALLMKLPLSNLRENWSRMLRLRVMERVLVSAHLL